MLTAAVQYADTPGYAALIIRRTFQQLSQPKALMDLAHEWFQATGAHWSGDTKTWTFPSGATLTFGHMDHANSKYNYQGGAFHFVGFDELTQFEEDMYTYLFSRRRRDMAHAEIPIRTRATANPGGIGHDWVKRRFISDECLAAPEVERFSRTWWKDGRLFVPAKLEDNPKGDIEEYRKSLAELPRVEREQLEHGDWKTHAAGRFSRLNFKRYVDIGDAFRLSQDGEAVRKVELGWIAIIDPANRKTKASKYTVILQVATDPLGRQYVTNRIRKQLAVGEIIPELYRLVKWFQPYWMMFVGIEANGFQIALVDDARQYDKYPMMPEIKELEPEGKSKLTRATPAIVKSEDGRLYVPEEAPWLEDFFAELEQFTGDEKLDSYTDQVDTLAYAVQCCNRYSLGGGATEPESFAAPGFKGGRL